MNVDITSREWRVCCKHSRNSMELSNSVKLSWTSPCQSECQPKRRVPPINSTEGLLRAAVGGYFSAVEKQDVATAAESLDLQNQPSDYEQHDGAKLAQQLKVLDRTLWVEMESLSTEPTGHKDDGLPSSRDYFGRHWRQTNRYLSTACAAR